MFFCQKCFIQGFFRRIPLVLHTLTHTSSKQYLHALSLSPNLYSFSHIHTHAKWHTHTHTYTHTLTHTHTYTHTPVKKECPSQACLLPLVWYITIDEYFKAENRKTKIKK